MATSPSLRTPASRAHGHHANVKCVRQTTGKQVRYGPPTPTLQPTPSSPSSRLVRPCPTSCPLGGGIVAPTSTPRYAQYAVSCPSPRKVLALSDPIGGLRLGIHTLRSLACLPALKRLHGETGCMIGWRLLEREHLVGRLDETAAHSGICLQ